MSDKTGGPAFPAAHPLTAPAGMTMLDYFAAAMLSGLVSSEAMMIALRDEAKERGELIDTMLAKSCYQQAAAMLTERAKP